MSKKPWEAITRLQITKNVKNTDDVSQILNTINKKTPAACTVDCSQPFIFSYFHSIVERVRG